MNSLSLKQIKEYNEEGYISPINVLSREEAFEIRKEIEYIENKWPKELEGLGRNYVHLISPIFDKICHNSNILDAVESIIGKNILSYSDNLELSIDQRENYGYVELGAGMYIILVQNGNTINAEYEFNFILK